jgi:phenylacetate-CoA ligase
MAWECLEAPGRFHVLLPDVWLESVGGELVVTRLRPGVFPLLRYRTGDSGSVVPEDCRCGYRGLSVVGFNGRRACAFLTPEGESRDAWQLAWLFKHYPLADFRLTQRAPSRFALEVVGAGPLDLASLRARLAAALALLGFPEPELSVRVAAALEARGDKPEPFRCALGDRCR